MFHMKKTAKKSFFVRADLKSGVGQNLDGNNPKYNGQHVVVLQVTMINDRHFTMLYEVVFKEDFNGLWKD